MVYQTNPVGIELYFYANAFFCFSIPIIMAADDHVSENTPWIYRIFINEKLKTGKK